MTAGLLLQYGANPNHQNTVNFNIILSLLSKIPGTWGGGGGGGGGGQISQPAIILLVIEYHG